MADKNVSAVDVANLDPLDAAAMVAKHVELEDVWVRGVQASSHIDPRELMSSKYEWRIGHPVPSYELQAATRQLRVFVTLNATAMRALAPDISSAASAHELPLMDVQIAVSLLYRLSTEPPPEDVRGALLTAFASINGCYNAWPYLRESFQSVTGRMGIKALVLPVYRVPPRRSRVPAKATSASPSPEAQAPASAEQGGPSTSR